MISSINELKNTIHKLVEKNEIVFITPHIGPDCDAIASAIALDTIVKKLGKKSYIIIDDLKSKMETAVKTIITDLSEDISIINSSNAQDILKNNDVLLITTDTNKSELVPFKSFDQFNDIIIIDHHMSGLTTINTDNIYIDIKSSSASEIMYFLLNNMGVQINSELANYLLAGINLDTAKFTKNISPSTMKIVAKLMDKGANMNYVNDLFLDSFDDDMRILNLISKTIWNIYTIGIALDEENPNQIYTKEDLAKTADYLLKYKGVNLAFALGYINDGLAYISGRSKDDINVGEIMTSFGGGGNEHSGAAIVETDDIKTLKLTLQDRIKPGNKLK